MKTYKYMKIIVSWLKTSDKHNFANIANGIKVRKKKSSAAKKHISLHLLKPVVLKRGAVALWSAICILLGCRKLLHIIH